MERIIALLPSIAIIALIALSSFLYLKWVGKLENFKNPEWCKRNSRKIFWTIDAPFVFVFVPAFEELVFRGPIILAFDCINSLLAWTGLIASTSLFALAHFEKTKLLSDYFIQEDGKGEGSGSFSSPQDNYKKILLQKIIRIAIRIPLGFLAGYYGIQCQSLFASFGIHVAWNIAAFIVPSVAIFLLVYLLGAILMLREITGKK